MATDNAKIVAELRKTHDRLLCQVADDGTRIKNEADYQADAEVALDVCWRAATALASAEALNERLVKFVERLGKTKFSITYLWVGLEARALLDSIDKGDDDGTA